MIKSAVLVAACFLASARARAQSVVVDHTCVDSADRAIPQEFLDKARGLKVLFGHQSVGGNVMEGLAALAEQKKERYACEFVNEPEASAFDEKAVWGEFAVGENEDPSRKIAHFREKLEEGYGKKADVAMMKLCFVDFTDDKARAKATFEECRDAMEALEKAFPKLRLVWWTAPLEESGNAGRNEYNRLVREHCKAEGKILFDLADIESHDAKGKARGEPSLCKAYSEDGGHLNDEGKRRAARAWWWLTARLAGWDGK